MTSNDYVRMARLQSALAVKSAKQGLSSSAACYRRDRDYAMKMARQYN